jgi:hypothetical protein
MPTSFIEASSTTTEGEEGEMEAEPDALEDMDDDRSVD